MSIEYRHYPIEEIRLDEEGDKPILKGYAAVFEKLSVPLWGFREKIAPNAFAKTLSTNSVVKALWNHNSDYPLGSTKNATLKLEEDDKGLRFELELPDTTAGQDALKSIRRGDVDGMSFGFEIRKDQWDESNPKDVIRTLLDVNLIEISPTPFPAYPQTSVKARTFMEAGLDFDALTGVFYRTQRSQPLTEADCDLIKASIRTLESYLPTEPVPEPEETREDEPQEIPEEQPPVQVEQFRRELDLLSLS